MCLGSRIHSSNFHIHARHNVRKMLFEHMAIIRKQHLLSREVNTIIKDTPPLDELRVLGQFLAALLLSSSREGLGVRLPERQEDRKRGMTR